MNDKTDIGIDIWMESLLTLTGAFLGPYLAVQGTLWIQDKNSKDSLSENIKYTESVINLFLVHEIEYNLKDVLKVQNIFHQRMNKNEPTQYILPNDFKMDEFNKIKYELIKYKNKDVIDVIELYSMFETIRQTTDLEEFSQDEFDRIKQVYLKNVGKYIKEI